MRRRDFELLNEAIDTSAIDLTARKALADGLLKYIEADWKLFISGREDRDAHDLYNDYHEAKRDPETYGLFIKRICNRAGEILTNVTIAHVEKQFGETIMIKPSDQGLCKIRPQYIYVEVKARELTDDVYKEYGGYFQGSTYSPYIVCNVNSDDVWIAAMGLAQVVAMGEGEDHDHLVRVIAPTFAHEYAHLEQLLRGDPFAAADFGYISAGGGKRGNRRDTQGGTLAWLRYKSSAKEIEAFAAGAASELIEDATRYGRWSSQSGIDDSRINDILRAIADGYADTRSLRGYTAIAWGTFTDEAERLGIPHYEMHETYKRFLKKVYQHVSNYRRERVGTRGHEHGWHIANAPAEWKVYAQKLPMRDCALKIAKEIAGDLLTKYPWQDGERFRGYCEEIYKGALFLLGAFFQKEDEYNDARDAAFEKSFTSLVIRLFTQGQERLRDAA